MFARNYILLDLVMHLQEFFFTILVPALIYAWNLLHKSIYTEVDDFTASCH
jgi:hypothetical protein